MVTRLTFPRFCCKKGHYFFGETAFKIGTVYAIVAPGCPVVDPLQVLTSGSPPFVFPDDQLTVLHLKRDECLVTEIQLNAVDDHHHRVQTVVLVLVTPVRPDLW